MQVHRGIKCASCRVSPIVGDRFKCLDCRNADLCADCYAVRASVHAKHELVLVDNVDVQRSSRPMSQPFLSARCFPPSEPGHVSQEACMRELAGDDAFIPLSRTSNVSFGLDCVPDDENPSNLLVEHIRAGSAAAAWNQEGALSGGNFMLVGDELRSVNDIEGSEARERSRDCLNHGCWNMFKQLVGLLPDICSFAPRNYIWRGLLTRVGQKVFPSCLLWLPGFQSSTVVPACSLLGLFQHHLFGPCLAH